MRHPGGAPALLHAQGSRVPSPAAAVQRRGLLPYVMRRPEEVPPHPLPLPAQPTIREIVGADKEAEYMAALETMAEMAFDDQARSPEGRATERSRGQGLLGQFHTSMRRELAGWARVDRTWPAQAVHCMAIAACGVQASRKAGWNHRRGRSRCLPACSAPAPTLATR